jgi:hypothetical protein
LLAPTIKPAPACALFGVPSFYVEFPCSAFSVPSFH